MPTAPPPEPVGLPPTDPAEAASAAGLRYVCSDDPGYVRKRHGRGFTYFDAKGQRVTDAKKRARFEALVIPPAWTDVWICRAKNGHLQACGRDEQGRKQYRYHPEWEARRSATKFDRLLPFATALPGLRAEVAADLAGDALTLRQVAALAVAILDETLIRVGNAQYARRNKTYGLTTLRRKHITFDGDTAQFTYTGKSKQDREITIADERLAALIRACDKLPGYEILTYRDERGKPQDLTSDDVNAYLREVTGEPFSAKDFRTWGGTVIAAEALCSRDVPGDEDTAEAGIRAAIQEASEALGNTVAVCRQYYVHPAIFEAYRTGRLHAEVCGGAEPWDGLDAAESSVARLLLSLEDEGRA